MSFSLEHFDGCVPVTGLKAFQYGASSLLIQGQGPFVSVINVKSGERLSKIRVFKRNNVHGFMIDESRCNEKERIDILVWGGQSLRMISIGGQGEGIEISHTTFEYTAPDWIYDICPAHVEDTLSLAYLVTGHNSLLSVDVGGTTDSKFSKAIRLRRVTAGVKSTLYSANVVALSPSHILIAVGTIFGEIIVWSCFREKDKDGKLNTTSSIHHFFTGHDGSVFGVDISEEIALTSENKAGRFLASCSDDRTVRIWDISDCFHVTSTDVSAYSTDGFDLRSTGYGSTTPRNIADGSESAVAKGWGHVSRVWNIHFLPVKGENPTVINLVSRGEDATCQLWTLDLSSQSSKETRYDLKRSSILSHHAGKQIWSLALAQGEQDANIVYTGGGDGGIRMFELSYVGNIASELDLPDRSPYNSETLVRYAHSKIDSGTVLPKVFAFVSRNSFITISVSGAVQLGSVDHSPSSEFRAKPQITWEDIAIDQELRSFPSISSLPHFGIAVIGSSSGRLRLYDHRAKTLTALTSVLLRPAKIMMLAAQPKVTDNGTPLQSFNFAVSYAQADHMDLFRVEFVENGYEVRQIKLSLPASFQVSVAASFCHDKYLAIGGNAGGLLVYKLDFQVDNIEYLFCDYRTHGKGLVLCMIPMDDEDDPDTGYLLSGGQDGNYCVHRLGRQGDMDGSENFKTVYQSTAPFSHVEDAYFDVTTGDLMLLGFRGVVCTLWNETTQTEIMTLECGGYRRILEFMPNPDVLGSGILIWIQQRSLHVLVADSVPPRPIRVGSHGREIKTMAIGNAKAGAGMPYIASGGEDTAVRISVPTKFAGDSSIWEPLKCLRIMNHHVTGLQQVKWSDDRQFLFSSAGKEEFFVWRIQSIPKFGIAPLMEAAAPTENSEGEHRITSFDVLGLEATASQSRFLVALAYSNSTLKVFLYTSSSTSCVFDLVGSGTYSTNCLTEIHFVQVGSTRFLVTGATDGHLAFWPLESSLAQIKFGIGRSMTPTDIQVTPTVQSIAWKIHHSIHTSSIKSLEITKLSPTSQLLISGGDDNSLSLTIFELEDPEEQPTITTISIPNAHASAVTAIKVLSITLKKDSNNSSSSSNSNDVTTVVNVASSGNDQRIKLWSVVIDRSKNKAPEHAISISLELNRYCAIADIAAMDVMEVRDSKSELVERMLVVSGVGMEMLRLSS